MYRTVIACLALAAATPASAQLASFDAPGAGTKPGQGTYANGVSEQGVVIGNVIDASSHYAGFTKSGGQDAVVFHASQDFETHAISIDQGGFTTGYFFDAKGNSHGFIFEGVESFDPPHAQSTQAIAIDNSHHVAGQFTGSDGRQREVALAGAKVDDEVLPHVHAAERGSERAGELLHHQFSDLRQIRELPELLIARAVIWREDLHPIY